MTRATVNVATSIAAIASNVTAPMATEANAHFLRVGHGIVVRFLNELRGPLRIHLPNARRLAIVRSVDWATPYVPFKLNLFRFLTNRYGIRFQLTLRRSFQLLMRYL